MSTITPILKPSATNLVTPSAKAQQFLGTLAFARIQAHVYHLQQSRFSGHIALDELYKGIGKVFDKVAEIYQGASNTIVRGYQFPPLREDDNCIGWLKDLTKYIQDNRYQFVSKDVTNIQNEIDNAQTLIQTALYKLQKLS